MHNGSTFLRISSTRLNFAFHVRDFTRRSGVLAWPWRTEKLTTAAMGWDTRSEQDRFVTGALDVGLNRA